MQIDRRTEIRAVYIHANGQPYVLYEMTPLEVIILEAYRALKASY